MFFIFYKTTNLVNNKTYYGAHISEKEMDSYLGSGTALKRAIEKYGKKIFIRENLKYFLDEESLYKYEKEFITEEIVSDPNNYNMTLGGIGGFSHIDSKGENNPMKNPEVVKKVMERRKKTIDNNKEYYDTLSRQALKVAHERQIGRPRSEETKNNIREGIKIFYENGGIPSNLGKTFSEDHVQKMKDSWTEERRTVHCERQRQRAMSGWSSNRKGKSCSEEHRANIRAAKKKYWEDKRNNRNDQSL